MQRSEVGPNIELSCQIEVQLMRNPQSLSPQSREQQYEESKDTYKKHEIEGWQASEGKMGLRDLEGPLKSQLDKFAVIREQVQSSMEAEQSSRVSIMQTLEKVMGQVNFELKQAGHQEDTRFIEQVEKHMAIVQKSKRDLLEIISGKSAEIQSLSLKMHNFAANQQEMPNRSNRAEARKAKKQRSKKQKKEQVDDELEFLDGCISQNQCKYTDADRLQGWLNELYSKRLVADFGMQITCYNWVLHMIHQHEQLQGKLEVLKNSFPALFIAYCEHFNYQEQLAEYFEECQAEKSQGSLKYFHGAFLPELTKLRNQGFIEKGKIIKEGKGGEKIYYQGETFNGEIFGKGHITYVMSNQLRKDEIIGCDNNFMIKSETYDGEFVKFAKDFSGLYEKGTLFTSDGRCLNYTKEKPEEGIDITGRSEKAFFMRTLFTNLALRLCDCC